MVVIVAREPTPESTASHFPFLKLPRELRDQVYSHVFVIEDGKSDRALRIERRHLKYFKPTAATILLLLRHDYFLLNRQIAREALEVLFKSHTVFFSCGPFVLKSLLTLIEQANGPCRQWLKWIKKIELDWVTFPNLRTYPPNRENGKDEWWWKQDNVEVDVDYIRGAPYNGHYDEHDYEGTYYDDNFYDPPTMSLYPVFHAPPSQSTANDPFGLSTHYPFANTAEEPDETDTFQEDCSSTKLDLLVSMEVAPLFDYLSGPSFAISSITLPLYFISKSSDHQRNATRPGHALPMKIRYWVKVCAHALIMLHSSARNASPLNEVRIKYMPWDIWATMEPADNLIRMVELGVWFNDPGDEDERQGEGEAFRAIWAELQQKGLSTTGDRMGFQADIKFIKWEGDLDWRVGDELEVVFTKDSSKQ